MVIRDILRNTVRVSFYVDDLNLKIPVEVDDLTVSILKGSSSHRLFTLASNPDDLWKDGDENKYWLRIVTNITGATPVYSSGTYYIYYDFVYGSDAYRFKDTLILSS